MNQLVAFDLDGVFADFATVAKDRIRNLVDQQRLERYDLVNNTFPDVHALLNAEAMRPDIYLELPPVGDSLELFKQIRELKGLDFCYITSRPPTVEIRRNTVAWLEAQRLDQFPLHFTHDKASKCLELGVSIMVEDTPQQAEKIVAGSNTNVILLRQSYNRMYQPSSSRIKIARCWMDVLFNILFWKGS